MRAVAHIENKGVAHRHQQGCGEQCGDHPSRNKPAAAAQGLGAQQQEQQNGNVDW